MMFSRVLTLGVAVLFLSGAAFAGAPHKGKPQPKKPVKMIAVKVCPMTGEAVQGKGGGTSVVGNYKVYFCCSSCKPGFDKLSGAEKQKKIAEALKKQRAGKS